MKESIYFFEEGIPGFEANREFRLVEEEDAPLAQLISVEDEGIGFILMRPDVIFPDYRVEMDEENEEVWAIVTLDRQNLTQSTLNLRAPILLNTVQKLGVQLILSDDLYSARQPIALSTPLAQDQEGVVG